MHLFEGTFKEKEKRAPQSLFCKRFSVRLSFISHSIPVIKTWNEISINFEKWSGYLTSEFLIYILCEYRGWWIAKVYECNKFPYREVGKQYAHLFDQQGNEKVYKFDTISLIIRPFVKLLKPPFQKKVNKRWILLLNLH